MWLKEEENNKEEEKKEKKYNIEEKVNIYLYISYYWMNFCNWSNQISKNFFYDK